MKYVPPSVKETAFNCPHCSALTSQTWFSAHAVSMKRDVLPVVLNSEDAKNLDLSGIKAEERERAMKWAERKARGMPFFAGDSEYRQVLDVNNLWFSRCYNCGEFAVWLCDRMLYPTKGEAPPANPDMPVDIRRDYDEASSILDQSPRGAAALIRLAIQKLCMELGQAGKNINDDIAALVRGGLDTRVQQALDAVRVIGNSAVHPGQIDLRDDKATAETLFRLLNLIVDKTISEPKHVAEVYASLPVGALKQIEKRDGRE